jgi:HAD superfamily hydrolase (TIGR01549 family)
MKARAAIFDVDGTLVDSVDLHAEAWCEAFAKFGHTIEYGEMRQQIGKGADQLMPVFLSEEELQRFGKKLEEDRKKIFKEKYLPKVRAFPRVRDLFVRLLSEGKRVTLASSAAGEELETYKKLCQIDDLIQQAVSKDDVKKSKPHPDIFEAALEDLGDIARPEIVVIGDTPYDAEAAVKAGLNVFGVLCGGFPEKQLRAAGCAAIYRDPDDLMKCYDEWA